MGSCSLAGTWGLTWAEGSPLCDPRHYVAIGLEGRRLLPARVPAPVHQVLLEAGLIDDPNLGLNSLRARWVEEMIWIYRHTFTAPDDALGRPAWITFERLELDATVWLNGREIGRWANAHRPARFDVSGALQAGDNLLVVRCDAGFHSASDRPAEGYFSGDIGRLTKRHWHRNPQYQVGWDWSARLTNVGILGEVALTWSEGPRLAQVTVFATVSDDLSRAVVHARATVQAPAAGEAVLRARIVETAQAAEAGLALAAGESRHELCLEIVEPRLWWPVGQGEPYCYTVELTLECGGEIQTASRRTGVRRVTMDQSPHPVTGRYCTLCVNNRPIFCKGGNLVPADLLYSAVSDERWRELVDLALSANFNLLRVWGGGHFAAPALCDACDEAGVLLWHDFLFACAQYPGHDPAFAAEVRDEVRWATREMAHHPSLVVWCGNNEIEWGDWAWGYDRATPAHPHYALFWHDIPKIVRDEDPSTLHWISSPWSPDHGEPNDPTLGDQHPWSVSLGTPGGADWWHYREFVDRFPNEGGVLGASSPATLRQFLPPGEQRLLSPSWDHHDNPFATMDSLPGRLGHAYQTVALWTGLDPLALDLDAYAALSGLLQAEGLSEYIANYRRRMFSSGAAVFWMYNDSWPVTHGWTIVDYYRRRKLSYHPVRRAFQPITVVVAVEGGEVVVFGVNDTPAEWAGGLRWGLFTLPGALADDSARPVTLPANAATPLARLPAARWDELGVPRTGAFAQLLDGGRAVAQHRFFRARFGELELAPLPTIALDRDGDDLVVRSDSFVWGVLLDVDGDRPLADNAFDLLPGVPYRLPWPVELGEPSVIATGNGLVHGRGA